MEDTIDYRGITQRQREAWATGDFNVIALQTMSSAEALVESVDPRPDQRVLDVACGSGNAALVAARRYCQVTGVDYVPALIARAQARADADASGARFLVGDAQALPFDDASFDVVLSVFGVMFAPNQTKAASELLRVCRPGGVIAVACWKPDHMAGDLFRAHARYVAPPLHVRPATYWGTEAGARELLGAHAELTMTTRVARQYFRSVEHAVDVFARYFGPTARALSTLDADGQRALKADVAELFRKYNRATDGTLVLEGEYLETKARRH